MPLSSEYIQQILKQLIVNRLKLDRTAESIADDEVLFGEGLGLDSIDSLEIIIGIEKEFGITITEEEMEEPEKIFYSVQTLADFIQNKQKDQA